jgi:hypothetical protein
MPSTAIKPLVFSVSLSHTFQPLGLSFLLSIWNQVSCRYFMWAWQKCFIFFIIPKPPPLLPDFSFYSILISN